MKKKGKSLKVLFFKDKIKILVKIIIFLFLFFFKLKKIFFFIIQVNLQFRIHPYWSH
jgi:hypothetical protein